jgi:CRP-like cAMP-binding protein
MIRRSHHDSARRIETSTDLCLPYDVQRERIAQNAADLHVEKGEWLIREGEVPSFFVLLEGALEVEKEYGGAGQVRGRYKPGDFYGETQFCSTRPPSRHYVRTCLPAYFAWIGCSSKSNSPILFYLGAEVQISRRKFLRH